MDDTFKKELRRKFYAPGLIVFALILILPVFYYGLPAYFSSPDIFYIKAKVAWVFAGNIFIDPISGYATMHPPWYHVIAAIFKLAGLSMNFILIFVTSINVLLTIFLIYQVVKSIYGPEAGLLVSLMMPVIFEFMGSRNILLATSFSFSVPFYLSGLWAYLKAKDSLSNYALSGTLWGLAFLISPTYLFLIALTFLYDIVSKRMFRKSAILIFSFLLAVIPFIYQAIYVYSKHLWGSGVFSFWRGLPGATWWKEFLVEFTSPTIHNPFGVPSIIFMVILLLVLVIIFKFRNVHWFVPVSFIAFIFTFYHFSGQYAIRIESLLSIFILATIFRVLLKSRYKLVWVIPFAALFLYSVIYHYDKTIDTYREEFAGYDSYLRSGEEFWKNSKSYLNQGEFVFCEKETYLKFLMYQTMTHALSAYKTLEYFQLKDEIAEELESDYKSAMNSADYAFIDSIASKYKIETAVVSGKDVDLPIFQVLQTRWTPVYRDNYFLILRKIASTKSKS